MGTHVNLSLYTGYDKFELLYEMFDAPYVPFGYERTVVGNYVFVRQLRRVELPCVNSTDGHLLAQDTINRVVILDKQNVSAYTADIFLNTTQKTAKSRTKSFPSGVFGGEFIGVDSIDGNEAAITSTFFCNEPVREIKQTIRNALVGVFSFPEAEMAEFDVAALRELSDAADGVTDEVVNAIRMNASALLDLDRFSVTVKFTYAFGDDGRLTFVGAMPEHLVSHLTADVIVPHFVTNDLKADVYEYMDLMKKRGQDEYEAWVAKTS